MYLVRVFPHRLVPMSDALAVIELCSVANGFRVLDMMVKRSPIDILEANLIEPGKFLILYAGGVAEVEEAQEAALDAAAANLIGKMMLPFAHPNLLLGLRGREVRIAADEYDCIGVVETTLIIGALVGADRSLKDADVDLTGIRIHGGLGGRAFYVVHGAQHDVEVALEAGKAHAELNGGVYRTEIIPRPHEDMVGWLLRPYPFQTKR